MIKTFLWNILYHKLRKDNPKTPYHKSEME